MKPINLYMFSLVENDIATEYENVLSDRSEKQKVREYELLTVKSLVDYLRPQVSLEDLDDFYYSYTIPQIGKEFDLLKINEDREVLNIELKCQEIPRDKIRKQLMINRYYLKNLSGKLYLYTYVKTDHRIYRLDEKDRLRVCDKDELLETIGRFSGAGIENIQRFFRPKTFLISPFHEPDDFLQDRYFLTMSQRDYERKILEIAKGEKPHDICGITGQAGTGKTLLLYDLAKKLSARGRTGIFHCGILNDGHIYLKSKWKDVDIHSVKHLVGSMGQYDYILIDEAQRMNRAHLQDVCRHCRKNGVMLIISYDYYQTLSCSERENGIADLLAQMEGYTECKLSGKIRTSPELASFIRNVMNLNSRPKKKMDYSNIEILYAPDIQEASKMINFYRETQNYVHIGHSREMIQGSPLDTLDYDMDTYHVIGQEFDNVLIVVDENFGYSKQGILGSAGPMTPDYVYSSLLLQGLSRAREKICIVVLNNYELFKKMIYIKLENCYE